MNKTQQGLQAVHFMGKKTRTPAKVKVQDERKTTWIRWRATGQSTLRKVPDAC